MILLIDDLRTFADGRECVVARSSRAANLWLDEHQGETIDELWLDYDLGGGGMLDSGMEVVKWLALQFTGTVGKVVIHSTHPNAKRMARGLEAVGIPYEYARDSFAEPMFAWIPDDDERWDPGVHA